MMNNLVTVRLGPKVHILVPWNDLHVAETTENLPWGALGLQETPAVYIPVNRG